ncbi:aminoglycoside N(3)-acetyltransferase [Leisingera daeponensis]|uniref:aminoglycoside N(3)-acetyltransferase n=1 Tax=Leisingera daeponensis TaxID=405746 RepID=UPI001C96C70E|nr:AAC(3) family N-acetyltransferase [Leisingera daeponensis]MBY6057725.1 AAC(3) family N-acetyltransferase [Leisingera daeponensis]
MALLTSDTLAADLQALGVVPGDGLFVHASMRALGPVAGGAAAVIEAMQAAAGPEGLLAMPGFSTDAYFPADLDRDSLPEAAVAEAERAVPGHDPERSPTAGMGVIAETFRTWPGTLRSSHPAVSVCLNGADAAEHLEPHRLAWALGEGTPMGRLRHRRQMKILLVGVGWNRCSALHTAESLAEVKRTKIRRFKTGSGDAPWMETPDAADDLNRLFPLVGAAFEGAGAVATGRLGAAECRLCSYSALVAFAAGWISEANRQSGDRH